MGSGIRSIGLRAYAMTSAANSRVPRHARMLVCQVDRVQLHLETRRPLFPSRDQSSRSAGTGPSGSWPHTVKAPLSDDTFSEMCVFLAPQIRGPMGQRRPAPHIPCRRPFEARRASRLEHRCQLLEQLGPIDARTGFGPQPHND